jgi:hypothetical protein
MDYNEENKNVDDVVSKKDIVRLYLLAGTYGSGKTTFGDHMKSSSVRSNQYAFAKHLKDKAVADFNIPKHLDLDKQEDKKFILMDKPFILSGPWEKNAFELVHAVSGRVPAKLDPSFLSTDYYTLAIGNIVYYVNRVTGHVYYREGKDNMYQMYWTVRAVLIAIGSFYRSIDNFYWVNYVLNQITSDIDKADKQFDRTTKYGCRIICDLCITDFRYPNEYNRIVEYFKNEYQNRDIIDVQIIPIYLMRNSDNIVTKDPSETALLTFEYFRYKIPNQNMSHYEFCRYISTNIFYIELLKK